MVAALRKRFLPLRINRCYEIPKVGLFESPTKYFNVLKEFDKKCWKEDGFEAVLYLTGWKDPNCRSYGVTIMIHLFSKIGRRKQ